MMYSMTGFGSGEAQEGETLYKVELRSLNSKVLDLNFKLPNQLKTHEGSLREMLGELIRGKVDILITEEKSSSEEVSSMQLDLSLMHQYHQQLKQFVAESGVDDSDMLRAILSLPNVIRENTTEVDQEAVNKALEQATKQAIVRLVEFRKKEGESQFQDLQEKIQNIEVCIPKIIEFEPDRLEKIRQRIDNDLKNLTDKITVEPGRLEAELVFYIGKLDISEEKVRLDAHINYFKEVMQDASLKEKGKILIFITQEMGREINTIGSKANHTGIQKLVVTMKDNLEKIKEQVYNIL